MANAAQQSRILIDIGHGPYNADVRDRPPYDPGVVSPIGWHEFCVNMVTAIAVQERLQTLGHYVAFVTQGFGLVERGMMARDFDLFLSIHHNALNGHAQGTEVAVHAVHAVEADRNLAASIAKTVAEALGIPDRGIIPLRLAVLSGARKTNVKAAVLTEGFFMDMAGVDLVGWARIEGLAIANAVARYLRPSETLS